MTSFGLLLLLLGAALIAVAKRLSSSYPERRAQAAAGLVLCATGLWTVVIRPGHASSAVVTVLACLLVGGLLAVHAARPEA